MTYWSFIFKHLWRNKRRVIGLFLCLVIVVTTITALYHLIEGMNEALGEEFDEIGANIIIYPKQNDLELSYAHLTVDGETVSLKLSDLEKIDQIEYRDYIVYVSPKLIDRLEINDRTVPLMGVYFENEKNMNIPMKLNGEFPTTELEVLVGFTIAKALQVNVGDSLSILNENFHVSGILEQQKSDNDNFLFMELKKAQSLVGRENQISLIEIAAHCHLCPIHEIANQIRMQMTTADVKPLMDVALAREDTLDRFRVFFYVIAIILLLTGSYLLIYFMSSYTSKRRQEIGLLRTIGFENRSIEKILLLEAILLGVVGGLIGYLLGIATVYMSIQVLFFDSVRFVLDIQNFLIIVGVSLFLMVIAVIGPLRFASTIDPVLALKKL